MTDWDQIREDYENNDKTLTQIITHHGVSRAALYAQARRSGWKMRGKGKRPRLRQGHKVRDGDGRLHDQESHKTLINRLYFAFEQQMADFENQTREGDTPDVTEKDARTLGSLARTLEKLIELKGETQESDENRDKEVNLERLREELARRIEHVRKEGGAE